MFHRSVRPRSVNSRDLGSLDAAELVEEARASAKTACVRLRVQICLLFKSLNLLPILLALIGARPKNSSALGHTLGHARPNDLSGR